MEAWGLGTFMVSACAFGVILFHPDSYFAEYDASIRNVPMGIAMGLTAVAIFTSPWGKRSGAHINPAVTLAFYRLGKIGTHDAIFYGIAQFAGATAGVALSWAVLGGALAAPGVNYVSTVPGAHGPYIAFLAEFSITFGLMCVVLFASNHSRLARFTPFIAGTLVAVYISIESPISGMSMNPARTFASALVGNTWTAAWIYFTAPPLAMLVAAEVYVRTRGLKKVFCAKLDHSGLARCIFDCRMDELKSEQTNPRLTLERIYD
jgi:aquaporin Z